MNDMMMFAYYIIESISDDGLKVIELGPNTKTLFSASECISNHHPELDKLSFTDDFEKQEEYRNKLELSIDEFESLKDESYQLFANQKYKNAGLFLKLKDAKGIYENYFIKNTNVTLVGVAIRTNFVDKLLEEVDEELLPTKLNSSVCVHIGNEIIGYDIGGFHSYVCNGLHKILEKHFSIQINEFGLLDNNYEEVSKFADFIQGQGEPVEWLPVSLYKII